MPLLHRHLVKIFPAYRAWHAHPQHGFWHWVSLATASALAAFVLLAGWEVAVRDVSVGPTINVRPKVARAAAPQTYDVAALMRGEIPPYTVRSGHPRLFITPENKAAIVAKIIQSDLGRRLFQAQVLDVAHAKINFDFSIVADGLPRNVRVFETFKAIEAYGMIYQLGTDIPGFNFLYPRDRYGQKGKEALLALASLVQATTVHFPNFGDNVGTRAYMLLAVGYDWLNDLLTPEEKQRVIGRLIDGVHVWPVGCSSDFPISDWTVDARCNPRSLNAGGHAYGSQRGMEIINPLSFAGDDVLMPIQVHIQGSGQVSFENAGAAGTRMVDELMRRTLWGPVGSLSRMEHLFGGAMDQEIGYLQYSDPFVPLVEAIYTATAMDFFQAGNFWKELPQWMIHDTLPHREDGPGPWYFMKMHQTYADTFNLNHWSYKRILGIATNYLGRAGETALADVAAWAVSPRLPGAEYDLFFYAVLLGDPLRSPKSPSESGLAPNLILPGPIARTFMRSRWNDYDATYAGHAISEHPCFRSDGFTMNTVWIWKNGGMLLTHKRGFSHDYGWPQPEPRYNHLVLYRPGDYGAYIPFGSSGDGGLNHDGCRGDERDVTKFTKKIGFLRGAAVVPDKYGYSAGDASLYFAGQSNSFTGLPKNAVNSSDRQFVWFPGEKDYFLLFDRVKTDGTSVQPHLTFNTVQEPVVSSNFGSPVVGESRTAGHWVIKDASTVTITNTQSYTGVSYSEYAKVGSQPPAHGRLFFTVLLPERPTIHKLGGAGQRYAIDVDDTFGGQEQYRNGFGTTGDMGGLGGLWRFHVTDPQLKTDNLYLMAMETTDSGQLQPSGQMTLLEGTGLVGARVGDSIGLFNPTYTPLVSGSLTLPAGVSGNFRLLFADLKPNTAYTVTTGATVHPVSATDAGTVYLENITLASGDLVAIAQGRTAALLPPPVASCGNRIIETPEVCDGNTQSCTEGGQTGTRTCNAPCNGWSACQVAVLTPRCGDAVINGAEQCDGANLNQQTCQTQGFDAGVLRCSTSCTFDASGCVKTPGANALHVATNGNDANPGSPGAPFKTIQKALGVAQPGQTIVVSDGTYREVLATQRAGVENQRITLKAVNPRQVVVTNLGNVLAINHPHHTFEGLVFDGQFGADRPIKMRGDGSFTILRDVEVKNTTRNCIDVSAAAAVGDREGILIERSAIHHCLAGSDTVQADAHGITGSRVRNFVIRETEIYYVSGDAVQFDPDRMNAPWDLRIENSHFWAGPLPTAAAGFSAGFRVGENALDTKTVAAATNAARSTVTVKNSTFNGWRNLPLLTNEAALNLKENVTAIVEGNTFYDNEIALRLRGPGNSGARITAFNNVFYDNDKAIRYEDRIEDLKLYHNTFGARNLQFFDACGSGCAYGAGLTVKNNLMLGPTKPPEAVDPSNLAVGPTVFVDVATNNYHLVAGASPVDAGILLPDVSADRDGVRRPLGSAVDVGAYEFRSGQPAPSSPPAGAGGGGGAVVRGDLSGDGKVTYADVRLHFQMLVGMATPDLTKADLTGDGRLTLADFRALLRLVVAR